MNFNINYSMNIEGRIRRQDIIGKTRVGLFSVVEKRVTNSYFKTSKGYMKVDPVLTLISVESDKGKVEAVMGTKIKETILFIKELMKREIPFEDIANEVSLNCNKLEIKRAVEDRLLYLDSLKCKEIIEQEIAITELK